MNIATWSIRNPIPSILLFALMAMAGAFAFFRLPVQELPDINLPLVAVSAELPGASPSQLETEVARPIEDAVAALEGLRQIRTTITGGNVQVDAEFTLETTLSDAQTRTKDAVDSIRSELPSDLLPPTVTSTNFAEDPILILAVQSSRMNETDLSWFVDDPLFRTIRAVSGVGRVERVGGAEREVEVVIDPVRLSGIGATVDDVSRALRQMQQQSSGGRGQIGGEEQAIRTVALADQASELEALPILLSNGTTVRLDQVATIRDGNAEREQVALLDGQPAVGLNIYRASGANEVKVAHSIRTALDELKARTPGLTLTHVGGSVDQTTEQYDASMAMLYEGAFLAIFVVWIFLRDWRSTLVAATALPLSILPTFAAMYWFGFTLNTLTLLALAVVTGILVDDAIVEIENIERHRRMGKAPIEATKDAVNEIAKAVIATTFSLVAVFLPTAMMSGYAGLFFTPFGWTAVVAVLFSLLVARLLTPMMAAYFLRGEGYTESEKSRRAQERLYLSKVRWCLAHPKTAITATLVFLAASVGLVFFIPAGFLPPDDGDWTEMSIELPPGTALQTTLEASEDVRLALTDVDGIEHVFARVGQSEPSTSGEVRQASLALVLAPRGERPSKSEVQVAIRESVARIPGIRSSVGDGGGEKLELLLTSDDLPALDRAAQSVVRELRALDGLTNINSTASAERQEIVIRPDLQRAAERGVTTEAIGEVVRIATRGDFDVEVGRLNLDRRQVFIRVRLKEGVRQDLTAIADLRVQGKDGLVTLGSIAEISLESGLSRIDRYDRKRYVSVTADLDDMAQGDAVADAETLPAVLALPATVSLVPEGDAQIGDEITASFLLAIAAGIVCIYCVLVLLFRDFFQPFTILSALPLSIGGAFLALFVTGSSLVLTAMIGLVMLMGIVAKNSILLVEYAILAIQDRGLSRTEALLEACRMRARPIVMTSAAMIAGLTPIALGIGFDASFRQPLAIAVIGGLVTSTLLSLLVVPVIFEVVDDLERRIRTLLGPVFPQPVHKEYATT
ncbi:efflux RND transporter permease subunit [Aurantiacibacter flavus]|uniref:Efflux RND transporter permease subunit n=1 Tax=Aurantiacibacter flavus TaxID=3145232 RepID=A0ABV0D3W4_9SPHN